MEDYIKFLKEKGLSDSEIRTAIDIRVNGITMTKAIYAFNSRYDAGSIDGFADSAINVLQNLYGSKLKKMRFETLYKKVYALMTTLTSEPDEDHIKDAIELYLG